MTEEKQSSKSKTYYVSWIHPENKKRIGAGVAFYDETYCEFRLKIDALKERKLYLKPIRSEDEKVIFQVEEVLEIKGRKQRRTQGLGYRDQSTDGHILFEVTPYLGNKLELIVA